MIDYIIYVREQERDFQQQQKKLNGSTAYIEFIFALSAERPPHQS